MESAQLTVVDWTLYIIIIEHLYEIVVNDSRRSSGNAGAIYNRYNVILFRFRLSANNSDVSDCPNTRSQANRIRTRSRTRVYVSRNWFKYMM